MIVLAVAKVNELYVWKTTYAKCVIEAVEDDGIIKFLEHFNGHTNALREELVHELFPLECVVRDRPFLIHDNRDFYTILNRNKKRYKDKYVALMVKAYEKPIKKLKRTR